MAVMIVLDRSRVLAQFRAMGWPGWLFAGVSGLGMIFFITGLRHTTVAHVAAGLGWVFLRERPQRAAVLASTAALVGVAIMVRFGSGGTAFGDILAFGMTLSMAVMMIIARRFRNIPVMPAACLSALLSGLVCIPVGHPMGVSPYDLILLALFGLVNSAAGLALFTLGARLLPPIETALIGSLDAPLAPLWVWLAFGETPGRNTIIGALVVFAAVGFHVLASEAARTRAAREEGGEAAIR
ncbi:MAG: DMT family transporter [Paracoccaceae bacterium]|nr:DMT family transporter [Paracoccaceae bacterium]